MPVISSFTPAASGRARLAAAVLLALLAGLGGASSAQAFTQLAQVRVLPPSGSGLPQGGKNVLLDSYLATRDPQSTRGNYKANPVGTVNMQFPAGSAVNPAAAGRGNVCQQSEYAPLPVLASQCAKAVVGRGWALLNSGAPVPQTQLPDAPPACTVGDSTQYARTWAAQPARGPDCVPVGSVYTRVVAYQGGILAARYWCYGWDWYTKEQSGLAGKPCYFKDGKGRTFNFAPTGQYPNPGYRAALNACNIIFANDNGVAPLAFGGTANRCGDTLSVIIPSLNGKGSGLGELAGGLVLSDFYLKLSHPRYLKAGPCPRGRYAVRTRFTYSQLLGESGLPPSNPATQDISYRGRCRR